MDMAEVGRLLPMHLALDHAGRISGCGPTLQKLIGPARHFDEAFELHRPHPGDAAPLDALSRAAHGGERVFLRLLRQPQTVLRGHGAIAHGQILLDLGFGIGLADAVRQFNLTDADFSPADLVMEILFLHEANAAVRGALSDYNMQLDTQRKAAESKAFTDALTGLANRRGLAAALEAAMRAARPDAEGQGRRARDQGDFALLHLDLDGFKAVNDTYGHPAGDLVLQHVADVLRAETRAGDTVARPGGDEFVLLLPGLESPAALDSLSRRIITLIEAPITVPEGVVRISASIGIVVSGDYGTGRLEEMAADADAALYAAKRGGRGRSCRRSDRGDGWAATLTRAEAVETGDGKVVALSPRVWPAGSVEGAGQPQGLRTPDTAGKMPLCDNPGDDM